MLHLPGLSVENTLRGTNITSRAPARVTAAGATVINTLINGVVIDGVTLSTGDRVLLTQQSPIAEVTTVTTNADSSGSLGGKYFKIYTTSMYYVWINVGGSADPAPGGTGIEVSISINDTANAVATAIASAVDGNINFGAVSTTNVVTITNAATGPVENAVDNDTGFGIATTVNGTSSVDNGVWEIGSYPVRPIDFNTGNSAGSAVVTIREGTDNADSTWQCTNDPPNDVIDTDELSFIDITGVGQLAIIGPATGTDNAIVRYDGSGQLVQNSGVLLDDSNNITGVASLTLSGVANNVIVAAASQTSGSSTIFVPNLNGVGGNIVITNAAQTLIEKTITDSSNNVTANALRSATTTVSVSGATAPVAGQTLTATSGTTATWQNTLTTKGDLLSRDSSVNIRVPVGTNGYFLGADSSLSAGIGWKVRPTKATWIIDQRTNGTNGGALTSGTGDLRELNRLFDSDQGTELSPSTNGVTLDIPNREFTLPPGRYDIHVRAPAYRVGSHKVIIEYFLGTWGVVGIGSAAISINSGANGCTTHSFLDHISVDSVNPSKYRLRHLVEFTRADGGGIATGLGFSEVYTEVVIIRISAD